MLLPNNVFSLSVTQIAENWRKNIATQSNTYDKERGLIVTHVAPC